MRYSFIDGIFLGEGLMLEEAKGINLLLDSSSVVCYRFGDGELASLIFSSLNLAYARLFITRYILIITVH